MSKSKQHGVGVPKGYGQKPKATSAEEQAFLAGQHKLAKEARAQLTAFNREQRKRSRRIEALVRKAKPAERPDAWLCPICGTVLPQDRLRKHFRRNHEDVI